jgi:predicted PurR-regulated permease PerM
VEKLVAVDISVKSILKVVFVLVGLVIAWQLQGIILSLIVAYILMAGLAPLVDYFDQNLHINKSAAILLTYLLALIVIGFLGFIIVPPLIEQVTELFENLPFFLATAVGVLGFEGSQRETSDYAQDLINYLASRFDTVSTQVITVTVGVFSGIFSFFTVAVLTFFLLLERNKIKENVFLFFPKIPKQRTTRMAHEIEKKLGAWVIGQLVLGFIVGVITWVGLFIFGVPYALPLAVVAGILELIPIIGPIISAIPAIIVALVQAPILGLGVGIFFLVVQQIENNILVPKVMERAVGLSPLITIIALLVGSTLLGFIGALLAVPIAATIKVIYDDYMEHRTN